MISVGVDVFKAKAQSVYLSRMRESCAALLKYCIWKRSWMLS